MLAGDRERALQQSVKLCGGNNKVPNLKKLAHCLGCKALLSGHSPVAELVLASRLITPAAVIGAKPQLAVGSPIKAVFCKACADKLMPHLPIALCQMYHGVLANVQRAIAAKEAEDATGELEDTEGGPEILLP